MRRSSQPASVTGSRMPDRLRAVAALVLVLAYALPLFVPPGPAPLLAPAYDASRLERLFPGVPGWWVSVRLICLLIGAVLAASLARTPVVTVSSRRPDLSGGRVSNRVLYAALGIAAVQVGVAHWTLYFNRALQLMYIVAFALPTVLLASADRPRWSECVRGWTWRTAAPIWTVPVAWLLLRIAVTYRSFRGVDFVDVRQAFDAVAKGASSDLNLLAGSLHYGISPLYLIFQGAGIVGPGTLLDWWWLQFISMFWILVAALGVGYLAAQLLSRRAAPVATAAFLFSPYVLSIPLSVVQLFLGPLFTVALLALVVLIERERPVWAIAALGAVAGIAATVPATVPIAAVALCAAGWSLRKPPRGDGLPVIIALLSFVAAVLPHPPDLSALHSLSERLSSARELWSGVEAGLFGQLSVAHSRLVVFMARPRRFDLLFGALLAPFAIPRTALRMWGDTLFDPFGAALSAFGIAICLRRAYRDREARVLLVLLAVALLLGWPSSYDRPSLIRIMIAPVPLALLAGVGFDVIRRGLGLRVNLEAVVAGAIVIGGVALFDLVNPRILARSAAGIILSVGDKAPTSQRVILVPAGFDPQNTALFAQYVPARPEAVHAYVGPDSLDTIAAAATSGLLFWSPGLEEQAAVSRGICQRWSGTALYTFLDGARLSRAFAARPAGPGWIPAWPRSQWSVAGCDTAPETESDRVATAMAAARTLLAQGRDGEAIDVLRAAARRAFVEVQLFETLADLLLTHAPPGKVEEAAYWARRACESTGAEVFLRLAEGLVQSPNDPRVVRAALTQLRGYDGSVRAH